MNKIYYKIIDNKTYYAAPLKGSALIGDCWVSNPTEEMLLADGWQEYIPEPHIRTLEEAKDEKIMNLSEYDSSEAVNQFYLGNQAMWLSKADRVGLALRLESEEAAGKTETSLWYGTIKYTLSVATFKVMLGQLEVYASECYDCTAQHKANILSFETIEDIDNYDFTTEYPEKLTFNLE